MHCEEKSRLQTLEILNNGRSAKLIASTEQQSEPMEKQTEAMEVQQKQYLDTLQSRSDGQTTVATSPAPSFPPCDFANELWKDFKKGWKPFTVPIRSSMMATMNMMKSAFPS